MPNTEDESITKYAGRCPFSECDHFFVAATTEQVGEHFNSHLPNGVPHKVAADACFELMDFRVVQNS